MEELIIRKATDSDMETLLRFEQGVISSERPFDPTLKNDPVHYYDMDVLINSSHIHLIVGEVNGQVIASGYARIEQAKHFVKHNEHAYLGFMYTLPEFRGKGINMKIIEELKRWSLSRNVTEMQLEVYADNSPAIKAYEKAGFVKHMITMRHGLEKVGEAS
jgi:GNAT superfamily N-acetyltransferase